MKLLTLRLTSSASGLSSGACVTCTSQEAELFRLASLVAPAGSTRCPSGTLVLILVMATIARCLTVATIQSAVKCGRA